METQKPPESGECRFTATTVRTQLDSYMDPVSGLYFYRPATYVTRCLTAHVPKRLRFQRAGIIPYVIDEGKIHYCLGVDAKYGELTDFGGCVELREPFLNTAVRELAEETLGLIDLRDPKYLERLQEGSISVYNDRGVVIIFVHVKVDRHKLVLDYQLRRTADSENAGLVWLTDADFRLLLRQTPSVPTYPKIYERVRSVLSYVDGLTGRSAD